MAAIKINTFKDGKQATTITVPLPLLKTIFKYLPKETVNAMEEDGVDIRTILESTDADFRGTLVEVENHNKNTRIVISLE
jgi:hypothetical protein